MYPCTSGHSPQRHVAGRSGVLVLEIEMPVAGMPKEEAECLLDVSL